MADNNVVIGIDVDTKEAGKSLSSLKQEFNELQKQLETTQVGTKEYVEVMKKLGKTKDEIGDLRNEINALNPEGKVKAFGELGNKLAGGFEAATGAAALFGSQSEEVEKTLLKVQAALALQQGIKEVAGLGDAFKEVGLILKANPLMLITTVIIGIGAALYALKDKIKPVSDAFDWLGDKIGAVIDAGKEFLDWIGVSDFALGDLSESIDKTAEGLERLGKIQEKNYDREIKLARAAGKDVTELEIAKQKAMQQTALTQLDSLKNLEATGKELSEEQKKRKAELVQSVIDTDNEIKVIRLEHQQEEREAYAKHLEEKRNLDKKNFDELVNDRLQYANAIEDGEKQEAERKRAEKEEQLAADKAAFEQYAADTDAIYQASEDTKFDITQKSAKQRQELDQETFNKYAEGTKQSLQSAQALTDLAFAYQLKKNKGNAAAELEIRKKQFKLNKAFGLVNSVIDGVGAVQKALNNPYPLNLILAIISGVLATANTVKIASTKFDDSGGGADTTASTPNIGGAATAAAPVVNQPNNTVTKLNDDGTVKKDNEKPIVIQNKIVETDITKKTSGVAKIQESAKIG